MPKKVFNGVALHLSEALTPELAVRYMPKSWEPPQALTDIFHITKETKSPLGIYKMVVQPHVRVRYVLGSQTFFHQGREIVNEQIVNKGVRVDTKQYMVARKCGWDEENKATIWRFAILKIDQPEGESAIFSWQAEKKATPKEDAPIVSGKCVLEAGVAEEPVIPKPVRIRAPRRTPTEAIKAMASVAPEMTVAEAALCLGATDTPVKVPRKRATKKDKESAPAKELAIA